MAASPAWILRNQRTGQVLSPHVLCKDNTGKEPHEWPTREYAEDARRTLAKAVDEDGKRQWTWVAEFQAESVEVKQGAGTDNST